MSGLVDIEGWIADAKQNVLGSLEQHVYEQATVNNLVDTALRSLVEAAVDRIQVQMPVASGVAGTLLGFLQPLVNVADQLGIDDKIMQLASSHGLDTAMRDRVISGFTRYLQDNGSRLMSVALDALLQKLTQR
ncbi:MAG: hypothetical protein JNK05_14375 [Myxococcales bacterium]|nr:hypothetical protein [Myxococcales bacterium]